MRFPKHKFTPRPKYGAKSTTRDGINFHSILEADYYSHLKLLEKAAGGVLYFHLQVPIALPGGTKYFVDFQVFYADRHVEYVDTKGMETAEFKRNKKQVEALYPFDIRVIKKGEF